MSCARLVLSPLDQKARAEMGGESGLWEVRWLHSSKYLAPRQQTQLCLDISSKMAQKTPATRQGISCPENLSSQRTPLHQHHWSQTQELPHQSCIWSGHRYRSWSHLGAPRLQ